MKVLLTGNQGYLGTVMTPVLQAAGHEVTGLDTGWFAGCVLGPVPSDPPTLQRDLRDVTASDLEGFDAVIHLAALSNDPLGHLAPKITEDINHLASVQLAERAKQAGVGRFVYSSTCSVYGAAGDGLVAEDAELAPVTPYAVSKVRVESDLDGLTDQDFCTVSLRNATAFGFSPRLRADIVLNNLVGHALLSGEVLVLSDGTPWRPLVHAADIADVFAAALAAPADEIRCGVRRSTSAPRRTTSPSRRSRRWSPPKPERRCGSPARPATTHAPTGWTSPGCAACCLGRRCVTASSTGPASWRPPTASTA